MRRISTILLILILGNAGPTLGAETDLPSRSAGTAIDWGLAIAWMLVGLATLGALAWGMRRFFFRRQEGPRNDPRQLLRELCKAHGLSRRAEQLLRKAASAIDTPHPGRFFLEPELLRQAQHCDQLKRNRRAIGLLYERLFGDDSE